MKQSIGITMPFPDNYGRIQADKSIIEPCEAIKDFTNSTWTEFLEQMMSRALAPMSQDELYAIANGIGITDATDMDVDELRKAIHPEYDPQYEEEE